MNYNRNEEVSELCESMIYQNFPKLKEFRQLHTKSWNHGAFYVVDNGENRVIVYFKLELHQAKVEYVQTVFTLKDDINTVTSMAKMFVKEGMEYQEEISM